MTSAPESVWYFIHDNMITLTNYMVEQGANGREIADAIEKPWKYEAEFRAARAEAKGRV